MFWRKSGVNSGYSRETYTNYHGITYLYILVSTLTYDVVVLNDEQLPESVESQKTPSPIKLRNWNSLKRVLDNRVFHKS